jgi:hypothetical protein
MPMVLDQAALDHRQGASPPEQLRLLANDPMNARATALARYGQAVQEKGMR